MTIVAGKTHIIYVDGTNAVDVFFLKDIVEDTTPQLGADLDANGNNILIDNGNFIGDENGAEQIKFATTASAVNELTATNAATGNGPEISATGGDTNIDLNISPKGTGRVVLGAGSVQQLVEKTTVAATAASGTINFDVVTQAVIYYTSNSSGNWTLNIRGDGSNSLDSIMDTGQTISIAHMVTNGGTGYYNSAVQVDGSSVTPEWQFGAPSAGNANSVDVYQYSVIKTGAATFKVFASQTQFT